MSKTAFIATRWGTDLPQHQQFLSALAAVLSSALMGDSLIQDGWANSLNLDFRGCFRQDYTVEGERHIMLQIVAYRREPEAELVDGAPAYVGYIFSFDLMLPEDGAPYSVYVKPSVDRAVFADNNPEQPFMTPIQLGVDAYKCQPVDGDVPVYQALQLVAQPLTALHSSFAKYLANEEQTNYAAAALYPI